MKYDVAVIGCGVTGAAVAYALAKYNVSTVVLEGENDVACKTTKANSAILHAGYDPKPGTQMAQLNVKGSALAIEICKKLDVPYRQIGSLVLAFTDDDKKHVEKLYDNAIKNGVPNVRIIDAQEVQKLEPNISELVKCALHAPSCAIVNPWEYALAMAQTAVKNGVDIKFNTSVTSIDKTDDAYILNTTNGQVQANYVVNASGVNSANVHDMVAEHSFDIQPSRGEYYLLDKSEGTRVNHVVFQCPTKEGKGVLVAPTVHGNLIVGPNAENTEKPDVTTTRNGLEFVSRVAKKSVPSIDFSASIRNFAGVRATCPQSEEFVISFAKPKFLDLAGMKSPGLSAAAAVGELAVQMLCEEGLECTQKDSFTDRREIVRFKELSLEQKQKLVSDNPLYGRIVCRCETVTEGEIVAAIHDVIPPCSIDAVKRRVGAGMGRCQGGFCGPRVMEILARELKVQPQQILQDTAGTYILTGRTKAIDVEEITAQSNSVGGAV